MSQSNRIERKKFYAQPIHCLYCGADTQVFERHTEEREPCEHLLYTAHDEGFMYLSKRAQSKLEELGFEVTNEPGFINVSPVTDELDEQYPHVDAITDAITLTDSHKVASYAPAPSFEGVFVGFAPVSD